MEFKYRIIFKNLVQRPGTKTVIKTDNDTVHTDNIEDAIVLVLKIANSLGPFVSFNVSEKDTK